MANEHCEKDILRQIQETMERVGKLESDITEIKNTYKEEEAELNKKIEGLIEENKLLCLYKKEVVILNQRIEELEKENMLLREDNKRMKSILRKDSSN